VSAANPLPIGETPDLNKAQKAHLLREAEAFSVESLVKLLRKPDLFDEELRHMAATFGSPLNLQDCYLPCCDLSTVTIPQGSLLKRACLANGNLLSASIQECNLDHTDFSWVS